MVIFEGSISHKVFKHRLNAEVKSSHNDIVLEIVGFVLIPLRLYTHVVRYGNVKAVKLASILTIVGILLNRLNTSVIAYNWHLVDRYVPTWMEIWITLTVIFVELIVLAWIVNRIPILSDPPSWSIDGKEDKIRKIYLVKEEKTKENEKEKEEWKVSSM